MNKSKYITDPVIRHAYDEDLNHGGTGAQYLAQAYEQNAFDYDAFRAENHLQTVTPVPSKEALIKVANLTRAADAWNAAAKASIARTGSKAELRAALDEAYSTLRPLTGMSTYPDATFAARWLEIATSILAR